MVDMHLMTPEERRLFFMMKEAVRQVLKEETPDWVDSKTMAAMLGKKKESHCREMIVAGKWNIKFRVIGGRYSFNTSSIEKFIEQNSF